MNKREKTKARKAMPTRNTRPVGAPAPVKFGLNQPEPFLPEITKAMVRKYLRRRYQNRMADYKSPTAAEGVMAERSLAQELKLSPLRTAFFASEAASRHAHHQHRATLKPAHRH